MDRERRRQRRARPLRHRAQPGHPAVDRSVAVGDMLGA
jgi:hypothetical protein